MDLDNLPEATDIGLAHCEEIEKTGTPRLVNLEGEVVVVVSRDAKHLCAHCIVAQGAHKRPPCDIKGDNVQHFHPRGKTTTGSASNPDCVHNFRCKEKIVFAKCKSDMEEAKKKKMASGMPVCCCTAKASLDFLIKLASLIWRQKTTGMGLALSQCHLPNWHCSSSLDQKN